MHVCMYVCTYVCMYVCSRIRALETVDCHGVLGNSPGPICGRAGLVCLAPGVRVVRAHGWLQLCWCGCGVLSYSQWSHDYPKTGSVD